MTSSSSPPSQCNGIGDDDPQPQLLVEDNEEPSKQPLNQQQQNPHEQSHSPPQTLNPERSDPSEDDPLDLEEDREDSPGISFTSFPSPLMADLSIITSPTHNPKRINKRKKCLSKKKQDSINKKVAILLQTLNPLPFIPSKNLDFPKHEKLLKRLGLWDFLQIEFDKSIRGDLLAQLIVTYDISKRCSHVNDNRVMVNRADLARALKLPMPAKKEKSGSVNVVEVVDLDWEESSEESVSFMEDFVSSWVLLHEDAWITTSEVMNSMQLIKGGHPEKVDWASLFWHMVENELKKGVQLVDCYYASHLQYLMKFQRDDILFCEEESKRVESEVEVKDDDEGGLNEASSRGEGNAVLEEANTMLTLGGQDIVEKDEIKCNALMDDEESKDEEQEQWNFDVKNEHFLQPCRMGEVRSLACHDESKHEAEEEEEEEMEMEEADDGADFDLEPNYGSLEGTNMNTNLLQGFEEPQLNFASQGQHLHGQSSMDLLSSRAGTHMIMGGPSMFGSSDKRAIEYEHDTTHLNGSNKRMRADITWDHKSSDFGFCIEQAQRLMEKAKMTYEAKEQALQESNVSQQILLGELQQRDNVIEQLHKIKLEEIEKKDQKIFRLERELHVMGNLLDGYRKALKETNKAFFEYRNRYQLPEEPIYKDAGPGGLVLSVTEIEALRQKQEEENRLTRCIIEQKYNEKLEMCVCVFENHFQMVQELDARLVSCENEVMLLKEMSEKRKTSDMAASTPTDSAASAPTDLAASAPTDSAASAPTDAAASAPTDAAASAATDAAASAATDAAASAATDAAASAATDAAASAATDAAASAPTDAAASAPTE